MRFAWCLFALAACIEPKLVPCGDLLCPTGTVCAGGACATQEQVDVCANLAEHDACSAEGAQNGHCLDGACREAQCGNRVIEYGEACDDGNAVPGDGCSARCDSDEHCGNGIVDYVADEQCDDANTNDADTCHTDCRVPRCGDGIVDAQNGEACDAGTLNSLEANAPCRPNCQPVTCGDGVTDTNETCDDNNQASGDGCSGDCRSTEVCGNGIVDGIKGEQCDSGIAGLSRDGCTSMCFAEADGWTLVPPSSIDGFQELKMVYDATRRRIVAFGIMQSTLSSATWEWDGLTWRERFPLHSPPTRVGMGLAYDALRSRVVLFGGYFGATKYDDTWEWDGVDWQLRPTTNRPSARGLVAMTYDADHQRIVLFGGQLLFGQQGNDTWTYDGTDWTAASQQNVPPVRESHVIEYDPVHHQVVMFGGRNNTSGALGDTWLWDGSNWNLVVSVSQPPAARYLGALAYAPSSAGLILFGGINSSFVPQPGTWLWNGTSWTQLSVTYEPAARSQQGMARDANGDMILFGGNSQSTRFYDTQAWTPTFPGSTTSYWLVRTPRSPTVEVAKLAYVPERGRTIMLGRYGQIAETWEFDGRVWAHVESAWDTLPRNAEDEIAYDEASGEVLAYVCTIDSCDLYRYTGAAWELIVVTNKPVHAGAKLVFDRARQRMLLVGGSEAGPATVSTMAWDGTQWSTLQLSSECPATTQQAVTYDRFRARVVMFGGSSTRGETWELTATAWQQRFSPVAPRAIMDSSIAYDPVRRSSILFGGRDGGSQVTNDTWEWNGLMWIQRPIAAPPPRRARVGLAYHAGIGRIVLYGGFGATSYNDTWTYGFSASSNPADTCIDADSDGDQLAGCADPDCWAICSPTCAPGETCSPTAPRCGDNVCSALEDYLTCPADCSP